MANELIYINTPKIKLNDAFLVIELLSNQENTFLTPLANSILEQLNTSFFELDELNVFAYSDHIIKLNHIIPINSILDNLTNMQKEKLFGDDTHNQIKKVLTTFNLQHEQKIYSTDNIARTINISKFNFLDYINQTITPLLNTEKIPQLIKQLKFLHYINDNLSEYHSNEEIYLTKNFINALENEEFLIKIIPLIPNKVYKTISNIINYDVTKLSKNDVQIYLNKIGNHKKNHLIREPFSQALIKYHIKSPNDLNLDKLDDIQLLELEKIIPNFLSTEQYQTCILKYLSEPLTNYETKIDILLTTLSNKNDITLNETTYKYIFNLIANTPKRQTSDSSTLFNIQKICEYINSNTIEGTSYFSNFIKQKAQLRNAEKYDFIKPIWNKILLENAITETANPSSNKFKI